MEHVHTTKGKEKRKQAMKETGMLFTRPMVRAILEGRKTQTRRVVKGVGHDNCIALRKPSKTKAGVFTHAMDAPKLGLCTCGQPGDRIYVRETFSQHPEWGQLAFRADGEEFEDADGWLWEPKWIPSIHMPKDLARIWLEITGVRLERIQDISEADALAEGARFELASIDSVRIGAAASFRSGFRNLWESTGGDWDANPWVWVVDFRVLSTTGRPA